MVENAEVLSIERQTNAAQLSKNTAPSTVTLMATIEDANKLGLVAGIGDLVLHLRGTQDDQAGPPRGILKSEDLFAKREPSIDERVQGVARVKAGQGDSKTWALVDGKWGEHKPPLEAKSTTTSDRQAAR